MIKVQVTSIRAGDFDVSYSYKITMGTRSPIVLKCSQPHRFGSREAAIAAGRRAVKRFRKEVEEYEDKGSKWSGYS